MRRRRQQEVGVEGLAIGRPQIGVGKARLEGPAGQRLGGQLQAAAIRVADVLESRATAGVLVDGDFVLGDDVEDRRVYAHPAGRHGLRAEFGVPAAARLEAEVQAARAVAVRQLDEGRGLEAAADVSIKTVVGVQLEQQPRHRSGRAVGPVAAVVAVARRDEIIRVAECDAGPAHAGVRGPLLGEPPLPLRVETGGPDLVVLVAFKGAGGAVVVDEPLAPVMHQIVLGAEGKPEALQDIVGVAERPSAVAPIDVHHAAGMRRCVLRGDRDVQVLLDPALAVVEGSLQAGAAVQAMVERGAGLVLDDRLTRVEGQCAGDHLARILVHQRAREAARVLGLELAQVVRHQRHAGVLAQCVSQLCVEVIAISLAVIAIAVGMEARKVRDPVERAPLSAELQCAAVGAIAADQNVALERRPFRPVLGQDVDHAAGGVAVERGERPAQHLDALGGVQGESRRLPLAVGHGGRDAVGDQPDAAHAEGRAGAETARGDLQVLGVVLPVLHHDARHPAEAFREIDLGAALADFIAVDAVDRRRDLEAGLRHAGRRHHDRVLLREHASRHEK